MPSRERLRILLMSSEATPYAKTGGLADVAGALPRALAALGHDVRLLMPKYRGVEARAGALTLAAGGIRVPLGDRVVEGGLFESRTPDGVTVYFLAHDHYYDRDDALRHRRRRLLGQLRALHLLLPGRARGGGRAGSGGLAAAGHPRQ